MFSIKNKIKKVLFVQAGHYHENGKLVKATNWLDKLTVPKIASLSLPLLAAYTDSSIEVEIIDEDFQDLDFNSDADVIAISAQVMQIKRAIDIADRFRKLGEKVIIGGFLATMHPELVESHVDAVCIGEGDAIWPEILNDIQAGRLRKYYKSEHPHKLDNLPVPRYDLIYKDRFTSYPVQATRGCPYTCNYCCIAWFYEGRYEFRPIEHVVRDIIATKSKYIHFVDDNLMENPTYSKKLFRAMSGLNIIWGAQVTINIATDSEMLKLAYQAGCRMAAIGVESLSQSILNGLGKTFSSVTQYKEAIKKIQSFGIAVHPLIIFGLNGEDDETYRRTVNFLSELNVPVAEFFINTPYPKTPNGQQLLKEEKIIDTDLSHYRDGYIVFKHDNLSGERILENYWKTLRHFYGLKNILTRIIKGNYRNKFIHFINALNYWIKIKRGIIPVYFGKDNDIPV